MWQSRKTLAEWLGRLPGTGTKGLRFKAAWPWDFSKTPSLFTQQEMGTQLSSGFGGGVKMVRKRSDIPPQLHCCRYTSVNGPVLIKSQFRWKPLLTEGQNMASWSETIEGTRWRWSPDRNLYTSSDLMLLYHFIHNVCNAFWEHLWLSASNPRKINDGGKKCIPP